MKGPLAFAGGMGSARRTVKSVEFYRSYIDTPFLATSSSGGSINGIVYVVYILTPYVQQIPVCLVKK